MRKKVTIVMGSIILITINLFIGINKNNKELHFKNISLMQASAGEIKCDGRNQNECTFSEVSDGIKYIYHSYGWLIATN